MSVALPPSRQWRVFDAPARNLTQPSCSICQVERSVEIGASMLLPSKGSRKNVPTLASLLSVVCITTCWCCWRVKSVYDGSSWFSRIRL
jgi:hypothetical protein